MTRGTPLRKQYRIEITFLIHVSTFNYENTSEGNTIMILLFFFFGGGRTVVLLLLYYGHDPVYGYVVAGVKKNHVLFTHPSDSSNMIRCFGLRFAVWAVKG